MFRPVQKITANWHLVKQCNYKCSFCYAHFEKASPFLDLGRSKGLLKELAGNGVYKVNFAGGEPLLHPHLHDLIEETVKLGMKASIISNGSLMTKRFIRETGPLLSQIGLSLDSLREETNLKIGRGYGSHVQIVERCLLRISELAPLCSKKVNTVVMRPNLGEDFAPFLSKFQVDRWKVFKVLRIEGENHEVYDDICITDTEFHSFLSRHEGMTPMVAEDNDDMTSSYLMIDPDGRVYQNQHGKYTRGEPVHVVGLAASVQRAGGFDHLKFEKRGGAYEL